MPPSSNLCRARRTVASPQPTAAGTSAGAHPSASKVRARTRFRIRTGCLPTDVAASSFRRSERLSRTGLVSLRGTRLITDSLDHEQDPTSIPDRFFAVAALVCAIPSSAKHLHPDQGAEQAPV
jgi:hypothetical protein